MGTARRASQRLPALWPPSSGLGGAPLTPPAAIGAGPPHGASRKGRLPVHRGTPPHRPTPRLSHHPRGRRRRDRDRCGALATIVEHDQPSSTTSGIGETNWRSNSAGQKSNWPFSANNSPANQWVTSNTMLLYPARRSIAEATPQRRPALPRNRESKQAANCPTPGPGDQSSLRPVRAGAPGGRC